MKNTVEKGKLSDVAIQNVGGGSFTAVIDDYYYYDENLIRRKFEDGKLYFPSVLVKALGVQDDITGESLYYQSDPGEPRFTHYKNMSFALSQVTHSEDIHVEEPIKCIAKYDSYLDLPTWMGVDKLRTQLEKTKKKKEHDLEMLVREEEYHVKKSLFYETLITTIVIFIQGILVTPFVLSQTLWIRTCYFVPTVTILVRFIGSSARRYNQFRTFVNTFKKKISKK